MMRSIKQQEKAAAFYSITAPYFKNMVPGRYTLIDCCAGDGSAGVRFQNDPGLEKIIFVDITELETFKRNTRSLKVAFELFSRGLELFRIEDYCDVKAGYSSTAVISIHPCGGLTDRVLELAVRTHSPIAVMPCCYNQHMKKYSLQTPPNRRKLLYPSENDYYDAFRLQYLRENSYTAVLEKIDKRITPFNNILVGIPLIVTLYEAP